ncbi:hypothetical protein CR983_01610 [Candidatus Saccharibacteria bacterium]|nr:MAG: hypothetical protein CR983_01610 [Candidatus Saccharibacteria bacterium]
MNTKITAYVVTICTVVLGAFSLAAAMPSSVAAMSPFSQFASQDADSDAQQARDAVDSNSGNLKCTVLDQKICDQAHEGDLAKSGLWLLLIEVLGILTMLVGVIAVGAIVYAGFLYASAQDNASQTKQALELIRNAIIGIVMYALLWASAQYLIPGGIFT